MDALCEVDILRGGIDNMAIDQAMLEQTATDSVLRLRVYRWIEPTVSLGYFQKFVEFENFESTQGLPVVRRATGGGALVHHFDWTYSIAVPAVLLAAAAPGPSARLYDCVHQAVQVWLGQFRIDAKLWSKDLQHPNCATSGCSFLCFERRHAGDIVSGDSKIMGSAQRRHSGAILQHGSLLMKTSPFAPSLLGISELSTAPNELTELDLEGFFDHLRASIASEFRVHFQSHPWLGELLPIKESIYAKFAGPDWTSRI
jgi:lipoate-protein ligase A